MPYFVIDACYDEHGHLLWRQWMDDTVGSHNELTHPTDPTRKIPHHEFLGLCNSDKSLRDKAGYNVYSQLPGETKARTRWERIVEACNHPDAPTHLKNLALK